MAMRDSKPWSVKCSSRSDRHRLTEFLYQPIVSKLWAARAPLARSVWPAVLQQGRSFGIAGAAQAIIPVVNHMAQSIAVAYQFLDLMLDGSQFLAGQAADRV